MHLAGLITPLLLSVFLLHIGSLQAQSVSIDTLYSRSDRAFAEGRYSEVLDLNLQAIQLAEETENCSLIVRANLKVAIAYYHVKDFVKTRTALNKALKESEACTQESLQRASALRLIGSL